MLNRKNNILRVGLALFAGLSFSMHVNAQTPVSENQSTEVTSGGLTSIYDIQFTEDSSGDSPYADEIVTTSGVVTGAFFGGYFIQDGAGAWNGLYVFDNESDPSIGDAVTITGLIEEFFDLTELKEISSFTVDSVTDVPEFTVLTTGDLDMEMYEGVLVRVEMAECTDDNVSANFGQWTIDDGTGSVFVNDLFYEYTPNEGDFYNVTGVLNYSFDEWKIEPRDASDVEIFVGVEENNSIQWSMYPNPVSKELTIETSTDNFLLEIISMDGKVISKEQYNQRTARLDLSDLASGMYLVQITDGNFTQSKLIEKK